MSEVTCTIRIRGRVQGVFFRGSAVDEARRLGLTGTVCNRPDGSVEAVATGPREDVERLVAWCRRGPPAARVEEVEVQWHEQPTRFPAFRSVR
jgi:acylphosphatase